MDTEAIREKLEDLAGDIDSLEENLPSLLKLIQDAVAVSTSTVPLLDKAKIYVLATYAIESILFSFLRLNGVQAKEHPIFRELTRVKEYFAKIKAAEEITLKGDNKPGARLDKHAAERVIKHGLSGNARHDRARQVRETTGAKRKLEKVGVGKHTRLDDKGKSSAQQGSIPVVKANDIDTSDSDSG
jgi:exosome complex protein LRP1